MSVTEAAFITPIFFMMVLAVIEFGLAMNDYLALSHSVRAGARTASASGDDVHADYGVLSWIQRESTALPQSQITRIVVYRASGFGDAPPAACQNGTPVTGVCNVYTGADMDRPKSDFGCRADRTLDRFWCPNTRNVTLSGTGTDYVGVWMRIEHDWVTKMFGSSRSFTDSSVIRLEPRTL